MQAARSRPWRWKVPGQLNPERRFDDDIKGALNERVRLVERPGDQDTEQLRVGNNPAHTAAMGASGAAERLMGCCPHIACNYDNPCSSDCPPPGL